MPMKITTQYEGVYLRALEEWAAMTGSEPETAWAGPGTYVGDGYYGDDGRPKATLRRAQP